MQVALLILKGLPALLDLLLERTQHLIGGASGGADQGSAAFHDRVQVLTREALLQRDGGRWDYRGGTAPAWP